MCSISLSSPPPPQAPSSLTASRASGFSAGELLMVALVPISTTRLPPLTHRGQAATVTSLSFTSLLSVLFLPYPNPWDELCRLCDVKVAIEENGDVTLSVHSGVSCASTHRPSRILSSWPPPPSSLLSTCFSSYSGGDGDFSP